MQPSLLEKNPPPGLLGKQGHNLRGNLIYSFLFCSTMIFVIFSPIIESLVWQGSNIADEALAAFCLLALLFDSLRLGKIEKSVMLYLAFCLYLLIASLLLGANQSIFNQVMQLFLQSKYFIFVYFAARFLDQKIALRFFKLLILGSILGSIINILLPEQFISFGLMDRIRNQFSNIVRIGGFQLEPNRLAHLFALLAFVSPRMLDLPKYQYYLLLAVSAVILVFTGGRVGMALFILGLSINLYIASDKRSRLLMALYLAAPLLVIILLFGLQQLFFTNIEDQSITGSMASFRILLLTEGISLALQYFPFGSGLATYGTVFAYDVGIYQTTEIASTFFYHRDTALYDNNFASLIGEVGFIGCFITLIFTYYTLRNVKNRFHTLQWLGIIFFVLTSLMFESFYSTSICAGALVLFLYGLEPYSKHHSKPFIRVPN